jgi:hypothetical protein
VIELGEAGRTLQLVEVGGALGMAGRRWARRARAWRRHVADDLVALADDEPARVGDLADDGGGQAPALADVLDLAELLGLTTASMRSCDSETMISNGFMRPRAAARA